MTLLFSNGDKGGVGKSFLAKAAIDHCHRNNIPMVALDADVRNADILQIFNDVLPGGVHRVNLRTEDGWSDLIDKMAENHGKANIIVNLPAGIGEEEEKFGDVFAEAVAQIGIPVTTTWMLNNEMESIKPLRHMLDKYGYDRASSIIAVRNHFFGDNFTFWEETKTRAEFIKHKGREADLPLLSAKVVEYLMRENLSFSSATDSTSMRLYERLVLQTWLKRIDDLFDSLDIFEFVPAK